MNEKSLESVLNGHETHISSFPIFLSTSIKVLLQDRWKWDRQQNSKNSKTAHQVMAETYTCWSILILYFHPDLNCKQPTHKIELNRVERYVLVVAIIKHIFLQPVSGSSFGLLRRFLSFRHVCSPSLFLPASLSLTFSTSLQPLIDVLPLPFFRARSLCSFYPWLISFPFSFSICLWRMPSGCFRYHLSSFIVCGHLKSTHTQARSESRNKYPRNNLRLRERRLVWTTEGKRKERSDHLKTCLGIVNEAAAAAFAEQLQVARGAMAKSWRGIFVYSVRKGSFPVYTRCKILSSYLYFYIHDIVGTRKSLCEPKHVSTADPLFHLDTLSLSPWGLPVNTKVASRSLSVLVVKKKIHQ